MDKIFVAYDSAKQNAIKGDFIDRLHSKYTVVLLFAICILIGIRQYDEDSINCWLPTHFSDDQVGYTHQLCWINNTYYYPHVTDADLFPESSKYTIHYYQYILFILFGQALLFLLPTLIWTTMASSSGGYIKKILDQAQKSKLLENLAQNIPKKRVNNEKQETQAKTEDEFEPLIITQDVKESFVKRFNSVVHTENEREDSSRFEPKQANKEEDSSKMGRKIRRFLSRANSKEKKILSFMEPSKGVKNLTRYYLFLKFFNLSNVIVQIVFFHAMFGNKFYRYGIDFFLTLWKNESPFALTTQFPIITFCDFYIHQNLRQIYWNAAQCILSINILIEKLFVIIWFWYFLLLVVTFLNILAWFQELMHVQKLSFITKYITIRKKMMSSHSQDKEISLDEKLEDQQSQGTFVVDHESMFMSHFLSDYLRNDGIVMLHLVRSVAGDIIFMDLLYELWMEFEKKLQKKETLIK